MMAVEYLSILLLAHFHVDASYPLFSGMYILFFNNAHPKGEAEEAGNDF
jgi:hypothetical protein